jgi:hypothetical protein
MWRLRWVYLNVWRPRWQRGAREEQCASERREQANHQHLGGRSFRLVQRQPSNDQRRAGGITGIGTVKVRSVASPHGGDLSMTVRILSDRSHNGVYDVVRRLSGAQTGPVVDT